MLSVPLESGSYLWGIDVPKRINTLDKNKLFIFITTTTLEKYIVFTSN